MTQENQDTSSMKKRAFALYRENRVEEARSLYARVCELDPLDAEAWFYQGIINSQAGAGEEAVRCLQQVVMLQPQRPEVHFNLGNVLKQVERFAEAETAYREALRLNPGFVAAHMNLGTLLKEQGRLDESLEEHRATLRLAPTVADGHFNLGNLLKDMGNFSEAEAAYREALRINSEFAEAYDNLGNVLRAQCRFKEAVGVHLEALRIKPDFAEARVDLGITLGKLGWYKEALAMYSEAMRIRPDYSQAWVSRALALTYLGRTDEALADYRHVQKLDPTCAAARIGEAWVLEKHGDFKEAFSILQPFLSEDNPEWMAVLIFSFLCKAMGLCDEAIARMEQCLERVVDPLEDNIRADFHFELGRLYDSKGNYDVAFGHYERGNELRRQVAEKFDLQNFVREIDAIIHAYSSDFMARAPRAKTGSRRPVFIVGMFRSGTSLVEQILASHSSIHGGGELEEMPRMVLDLPAMLDGDVPYPACLAGMEQRHVDQMAKRYLDFIAGLSPDAQRVTDKMPSNFLHLGLINLLFPEARVIHCVRDPLDTCLSCYFQNFEGRHTYTQDLTILGGYYLQYQRLMAHWAEVLDIAMMEVRYEELVADQERVSREMIDFCGLDWDSRCLQFYREKRLVVTASHDQVRQPMYQKSIARWRNYESFIGPLREILSHGS